MTGGSKPIFRIRRRRPGWEMRKAGDAARDARDWLKSEAFYANYLALNPDDWPIWVQRGHAQKEAGNLAGAERSYRRAADISPQQADPFFHLGTVMRMINRRSAAIDYFKRAAALGDKNAAHDLGGYGITIEAGARLDADVLPWVTSPTSMRMLVDADAARDLQRWEEAEALYGAYLTIRPDCEQAQKNLEFVRQSRRAPR